MKILISTTFTSTSLLRADNIDSLPPGNDFQEELVRYFQQRHGPRVWIADGPEVTDPAVNAWREHNPGVDLYLCLRDQKYVSLHARPLTLIGIETLPFPARGGRSDSDWEEKIIQTAEVHHSLSVAREAMDLVNRAREAKGPSKVALVGAGIVNLITAELLAHHGHEVHVYDASPDPRSCEDWTCLGVTHGGGDARMYTFTEADNYNEKGSEIYQNMASIFRKTVQEGSWSVKEPEKFSRAELAWIEAFERIPVWTARIYSENIYAVNRESGLLWNELRERVPDLFEGTVYAGDILRMYTDPVAVEAAIGLNQRLGALIKGSSLDEFLQDNPQFQPASEQGALAGGITVKGFTLNVHAFSRKLMQRIENLGGQFHWDCGVEKMERNEAGEVVSLRWGKNRIVADHYVVSPGVQGNALLKGTQSENLLQGVLGVWLQIPNLHGLQHSIKIHRDGHLVEDINVTVAIDPQTGEDILILGGGYGYVGLDRPDPNSPELKALFDELEEVARIYFPDAHAAAMAADSFYPKGQRKFCIRPFTPSGLGIFEVQPATKNGLLLVTGGNNTGGFAQAPAIARAVLKALSGELDPMHVWFHPNRAGHQLATSPQPQASVL